MGRAESKANRIHKILGMLLASPKGLTQAEIARRTGVNRSTIHRDLADLTHNYPVYEELDGRVGIDRSSFLVQVPITLHEAMAIHLAARLLARRTERHNPHAAAVLRKLGEALEKLAPRISQHLRLSAEAMDESMQRDDPRTQQVLEKLTLAWAEGRKVRIWHRLEAGGNVYSYILAPYYIEAYAGGQSAYVTGDCEPIGGVRTFRIERIERVELTQYTFDIRADFNPGSLFEDAWGMWSSDAAPVEVVLRFSARAASRVKATRWHRSEVVEEQADGALVWRARIAEPMEMLAWIWGWWADVEVLEPEALRGEIEQEVRRMMALYNRGKGQG